MKMELAELLDIAKDGKRSLERIADSLEVLATKAMKGESLSFLRYCVNCERMTFGFTKCAWCGRVHEPK